MEKRDIVVLGQPDWMEGFKTNTKKIISGFIKHHRVLYVQTPANRLSFFTQKENPAIQKRIRVIKKEVEPLVRVGKNLWTLIPDFKEEPLDFAFNAWSYQYINKINCQRLAKSILDTTNKIGFKDFLLFNDSNPVLGVHLKELLKPEKYIYYLSHYSFTKGNGKMIEISELKTLKKADIVLTNSKYYQQYASNINQNTSFIGQGPPISIPNNTQEEKNSLHKLMGNNLPLIGTLARTSLQNIDFDILTQLLSERPKWNFVLLTKNKNQFKLYQNSVLKTFPNFTTILCENESQKRVYLQELDVCIIPESLSTENMGKYPVYLDLLLSLGKPVVATRHIANEAFSEHAYMASSPEEFIVKVEHALVEDNETLIKERMTFAGMHNWENTIKAIYESIGLYSKKHLVA